MREMGDARVFYDASGRHAAFFLQQVNAVPHSTWAKWVAHGFRLP